MWLLYFSLSYCRYIYVLVNLAIWYGIQNKDTAVTLRLLYNVESEYIKTISLKEVLVRTKRKHLKFSISFGVYYTQVLFLGTS